MTQVTTLLESFRPVSIYRYMCTRTNKNTLQHSPKSQYKTAAIFWNATEFWINLKKRKYYPHSVEWKSLHSGTQLSLSFPTSPWDLLCFRDEFLIEIISTQWSWKFFKKSLSHPPTSFTSCPFHLYSSVNNCGYF